MLEEIPPERSVIVVELIVPTVMLGAPVNPDALAALPVHDPELPVTLPLKVDAVELVKVVHETDPPLWLVAVAAVPVHDPELPEQFPVNDPVIEAVAVMFDA